MVVNVNPASHSEGIAPGYLPEEAGFSLELVQASTARQKTVDIGSGFRHFTVSVPSIKAALARAAAAEFEIVEGTAWEMGEVYIRVRSAAKDEFFTLSGGVQFRLKNLVPCSV
jgi:hypothetical protein